MRASTLSTGSFALLATLACAARAGAQSAPPTEVSATGGGGATASVTAAPATRGDGALRAGTRPFYAAAGLGVAVSTSGGATGLRLSQAFGYHFFRDSSGPALGVELQETLGAAFQFSAGARFAWDIPVSAALGLYLSPSLRAGVWLATVSVLGNTATATAFDLAPAFDVKLVIADRGLVYVRPVGFDLLFGNNGAGGTSVGALYEFSVGGGVTF